MPENNKSTATMKREGDIITLSNYTVAKPKQDVKVVLSLQVELPGLPADCPRYIWEHAIRNLWVRIQAHLRKLTEAEIIALDGQTINGEDLTQTFESKRKTADPVGKITNLFAGLNDEQKEELIASLRA